VRAKEKQLEKVQFAWMSRPSAKGNSLSQKEVRGNQITKEAMELKCRNRLERQRILAKFRRASYDLSRRTRPFFRCYRPFRSSTFATGISGHGPPDCGGGKEKTAALAACGCLACPLQCHRKRSRTYEISQVRRYRYWHLVDRGLLRFTCLLFDPKRT